jgi:hypothetical protein
MSGRAVGAACALAFLAIAATELHRHGLTIDAPSLFYAGDRTLYWFTHSGVPDALDYYRRDPPDFHTHFLRYPEPGDPLHYPVVPGFVAAVVASIGAALFGLHPIDGHHLGIVLLHAVGLFFYGVYAVRLLGTTGGLIATVCYTLFPTILGHAFNNAKDIPCSDFYACGLLAGGVASLRPNWRDGLATGTFFGLSLSSKINGAVGLAVWLLWTAILFAVRWWRERRPDWRLPVLAVGVAAMATALFFILWPWLWQGSPSQWMEHLEEYRRFYVYYAAGPRLSFTAYPFRAVLFMTPPLVLVLALLYLALGVDWRSWKARGDAFVESLAIWGLLMLWTLLPLVRSALPHSNFYDGNRHFIEHIGGLCAMAGAGGAVAVRLARQHLGQRAPAALWTAAGLLWVSLIVPWLAYRPYEATYFNFLVGGLGGAQRRALFSMAPPHDQRVLGTEGDYWYSSVAEADDQLAVRVPAGGSIGLCGPPVPQVDMQWHGPGPIHPYASLEQADYVYLAPRGLFCDWAAVRELESHRPILHRVERGGGLIYEILGPTTPTHDPVTPLPASG